MGDEAKVYVTNAYAIGQAAGAAVAQQVTPYLLAIQQQLSALSMEVKNLEAEVNKLKSMEIAKAQAKANEISKNIETIEELSNIAETEYTSEMEEIKTDYDNSINEMLHEFLERISANTETLDQLKKELGYIDALKQSMFVTVNELKSIHGWNYKVRLTKLKAEHEKILKNIDGFLAERKHTADKILSLQTPLPEQIVAAKEPSIFYMPFWVIGLTDDNGREEIHVLPIQRAIFPNEIPTRENPYIPHLVIHEKYGIGEKLQDVLWYVSQPENVEKARANSILREKDEILRNINRLYDTGCVGAPFVEALNKFVGGLKEGMKTVMATLNHAPVHKKPENKMPKMRY